MVCDCLFEGGLLGCIVWCYLLIVLFYSYFVVDVCCVFRCFGDDLCLRLIATCLYCVQSSGFVVVWC